MNISCMPTTFIHLCCALSISSMVHTNARASTEEASTRISLGAGIASIPEYEGASDNKLRAIPVISIVSGRWSFGGVGGLARLNLSDDSNIEFGPRLGYGPGRDESDSPRLHGLGDIDGGMDAGVFFSNKINQFKFSMKLGTGISGEIKGSKLDVSVAYTFTLSAQHRLSLATATSWIDDTYAKQYFSVSATQATNSGLPVYNAQSGFKDIGVSLSWMYFADKHWMSSLILNTKQLSNDAKYSPVVEDEQQSMIIYSLIYNF